MYRIYIPIVFFVIFLGWALFRLLIKKDLKRNLGGLYIGLTFIGVWIVIYYFLMN
ncbi:hypothetical protein [Flavobacterium sp.]|uniref:hypothetical protein n=1 Tax=Flavobacterium sp. TaxID=239 RepID=UPI0035B242BB